MEICGNCNGEKFIYNPHKTVCRHCYGTGEVADWIEQATGRPNPHRKEVFTFDSSKDDDGEMMLRLKLKYGV